MSAFWSWVAGAVAECCCRVPLQGPAVRVLFLLWSLVAAGCCCKVLLSGCHVHFGAGLLPSLYYDCTWAMFSEEKVHVDCECNVPFISIIFYDLRNSYAISAACFDMILRPIAFSMVMVVYLSKICSKAVQIEAIGN